MFGKLQEKAGFRRFTGYLKQQWKNHQNDTYLFDHIIPQKIKEFFLLMIHCKYFLDTILSIYIYSVEFVNIIAAIDSDIYVCYYIVVKINQNTQEKYLAWQMADDPDTWYLFQLTGYGEWLEKEVAIFMRCATGF